MTTATPVSNRVPVGFVEAFSLFFKNYFSTTGRSSRGAYWWWTLWSVIIGGATGVFDLVIFGLLLSMEQVAEIGVLSNLFSLAIFIPGITLTIRRLHDVNRSGWMYLLVFTCIGIIPVLYWLVSAGTPGQNDFGPDLEAGRNPNVG